MIKFQDIKIGDYVMATYEGQTVQGEVTNLNRDEKQVCVNNGVQDFWFETAELGGIPLDDHQLARLKFSRQDNEDGSVKYMKGAFRILIHEKDKFSDFEVWYRDERRHVVGPAYLHQLQNHYLDMTKVHLTTEAFA